MALRTEAKCPRCGRELEYGVRGLYCSKCRMWFEAEVCDVCETGFLKGTELRKPRSLEGEDPEIALVCRACDEELSANEY